MSRPGAYDEDDVRDASGGGGWFGSRYEPDRALVLAKLEDEARNRRATERARFPRWARDLDAEIEGVAK